MANNEYLSIHIRDIENARNLLAACLNYFQAMDLAESQRQLHAYTESPMAQDLGALKERFDGYMADFLLERYESEDVETDSEEVEEEEELSAHPLGEFKPPKQPARVIPVEELASRTELPAEYRE